MTDPMELVERMETYADPHEEIGMTYVRAALIEAAACIRDLVEWRPIETAPRDGRYILAMMTGADDRWEHLNGRAFVVRNRSLSADDYDLGWDVYPGFGGVSDRWFSGWLPLPPAP